MIQWHQIKSELCIHSSPCSPWFDHHFDAGDNDHDFNAVDADDFDAGDDNDIDAGDNDDFGGGNYCDDDLGASDYKCYFMDHPGPRVNLHWEKSS